MSWTTIDSEQETMYQSEANDYEGVYKDLTLVVERMLANKSDDEADSAGAILFYTNATNGFIKASWYDPETGNSVGNYSYELELKTMWETSLEHEDGSFFFDNEAHIGICCTYEDFIDDFDVYEANELNSEPEELII